MRSASAHPPTSARDAVLDRVRGWLADPAFEPPLLPASAAELHRLSMSRDVTFERVVATLETDPLLAADVLRMANTPAYRGRYPVETLAQAAQRLGVSGIRDVAFHVSMFGRVFRCASYGPVMEQLRLHSTTSLHLLRALTRESSLCDYAGLVGLLHHVGMAVVVLALAELQQRRVSDLVLAEVLTQCQAEAGAAVIRAWELPVGLMDGCSGTARPQTLEAALARLADHACVSLGRGIALADRELCAVSAETLVQAQEVVGLGAGALETARDDVARALRPH